MSATRRTPGAPWLSLRLLRVVSTVALGASLMIPIVVSYPFTPFGTLVVAVVLFALFVGGLASTRHAFRAVVQTGFARVDRAAEIASLGAKRAERAAEENERFERARELNEGLRVPLDAILEDTDALLRSGERLAPEVRDDVLSIAGSVLHLRSVFDDVIDFASMESGRALVLDRRPMDVVALVRDAARLIEGQIKSEHVRVVVEVPNDPIVAEVDATRIRQILMNLGSNAVKFTKKGDIVFRAQRDGDHVVLSVRDSGEGMTRAEVEEIFEEFRQVGDYARRVRGSGLGLAISKKLVELHRGTLEVESLVEFGSVFHARIPLRAPASDPPVRDPTERVATRSAPP